MNKIEYGTLAPVLGGVPELRLRPIQDSDTDNIVLWRNKEEVRSQFIFRDTLTPEMHRNWLRDKVYTGLVIQYIIEWDGRSIGSVYLRDIDLKNESGEFGIFIGETGERGKGIGSLTAKAFTEYCFELGFHRIFLRVLDTNAIAKGSYVKAGFILEGTARDMVYIGGVRYDVTFMSILKE